MSMNPGTKVIARKGNGRNIPEGATGEVVHAPQFGSRPDPRYVWVKFDKQGLRCMLVEELMQDLREFLSIGYGGGGGGGKGFMAGGGGGGSGAPTPTPTPGSAGYQRATMTTHYTRRPGEGWNLDHTSYDGFDQSEAEPEHRPFTVAEWNKVWLDRTLPEATGKTVKFRRWNAITEALANNASETLRSIEQSVLNAAEHAVNPPHITGADDE